MKNLSRREMLKLMGTTSAVLATGGISLEAADRAAAAAQDTVTLDVIARQPEYLNLQRQIWDIFERENPDIKINLFAVNENEYAALQARIAGGYIPHIATTPTTTTDRT